MTNVTVSPAPATSPVAPGLDDIRDIKPPIEIPTGWEGLWWTLAGVAAVAILLLLLRWWRKKRARAVTPPPVPAHVRARQKLDDALKLISQPKPFVIAVSDT